MAQTNGVNQGRGIDKWNRLYSELNTNPDDFELWQDLIDCVDREFDLSKSSSQHHLQLFRFTYDSFLQRFPLFHGFWVKYAETEFRLGGSDRGEEIYERAVSIMPGCLDLWIGYCKFKMIVGIANASEVRLVFERAAKSIGAHFLAHEFWDTYIEFITQHYGDANTQVYKLLQHIIQIPLHQYSLYFERLSELGKIIPSQYLVSEEYLVQFRAEYEIEQVEEQEAREVNGDKDEVTEPKLTEDEDLRSRVDTYHTSIYKSVHNQVEARWPLERAIKRPYFHLVYISENELINWNRYLDFEEAEGNIERVRLLYERALVSTGSREEIWLRYVRYLIGNNKFEEARVLFARSCLVLPIGRLELRHHFAKFEESSGNYDAAKSIYDEILNAFANSVETILLYSGFLNRRTGNIEDKLTYLLSKLAADLSELEKSVIHKEIISSYVRQGRIDDAVGSFANRVKDLGQSYPFWKDYFLFAMRHLDQPQVLDVYSKIKSLVNIEPELLRELINMYMDYLLDQQQSSAKDYMDVGQTIHRLALEA